MIKLLIITILLTGCLTTKQTNKDNCCKKEIKKWKKLYVNLLKKLLLINFV